MKAIIEVAKSGSAIRAARQQIKDSEIGKPVNFRLSFESAKSLFSELTPARLDLLDTLSKIEPCSIYALAKTAERNYSNVHTDVNRLEELECVVEPGDAAAVLERRDVREHGLLRLAS